MAASAEDTGSYLLFKPAASALQAGNSDYMAMPGAGTLKASATAEAIGSAMDPDRSSVKLSVPSHPAALSSFDSDYMEMAAHAVHASKVVSEPGGTKASDVVFAKKLSTSSRGSDELGYKNMPDVSSSKKSSLVSRSGDEYMSMHVSHDGGYVDMKNVPTHHSTGWRQNISYFCIGFLLFLCSLSKGPR